MPTESKIKDPLTGIQAPTPRKANGHKENGKSAIKTKGSSAREVIEAKRGIVLDIGCGDEESHYPGAVGMDKQDLSGVDIVHDWNDFPWPFEDGEVLTIIASHVIEHVNPVDGHFIRWMDEAWRVLRTGGQMAIVTPYAGSSLFWQDPTHCNGVTERTMWYFAPHHPSRYHVFYHPKPWWIEQCYFNTEGMLESVLRKIEDDPEFHILGSRDIPTAGTGA
jgi:SAM-dependent methyltransferase